MRRRGLPRAATTLLTPGFGSESAGSLPIRVPDGTPLTTGRRRWKAAVLAGSPGEGWASALRRGVSGPGPLDRLGHQHPGDLGDLHMLGLTRRPQPLERLLGASSGAAHQDAAGLVDDDTVCQRVSELGGETL